MSLTYEEAILKKVEILPGCISCGTCEAVCPEVFKVKSVSEVNKDADLEAYKEEIREAAEVCPVGTICYEE